MPGGYVSVVPGVGKSVWSNRVSAGFVLVDPMCSLARQISLCSLALRIPLWWQ